MTRGVKAVVMFPETLPLHTRVRLTAQLFKVLERAEKLGCQFHFGVADRRSMPNWDSRNSGGLIEQVTK